MEAPGSGAPTQAAQSQPNQPADPKAPQGQAPAGGPATAGTVKEAAQAVMEKFKIKVDGREEEVDLEELKRGYGHQKAANKILQEGKQARKQAEMFISMLKDPDKVEEILEKLGHKPRELFETRLASKIKREILEKEDPRAIELEDARAKLKAYEDLERKQKEAQEKRALDEMKAKYAKDYNDQFVGALKETGLPATKESVSKMAQYISRAAKIGYEITPQEAAKMVQEDIQQYKIALLSQADGETLLNMLGDEMAEKILTARGSRVKSPTLPTPQEQGQRRERRTNTNISDKERRRMTRGWG